MLFHDVDFSASGAKAFIDHNGRPQYLLDDREPIMELTG
jgi:hypothetical protein